MAQAPPTLVSSKNDNNKPLSHPLRQIELQSNAQTPFLEAYRSTDGKTGLNGSVIFDTVVKDTFKRYDQVTGLYVFPVNGFWVVTAWMPSAVNRYLEPGHVYIETVGASTNRVTTWQFYAGPNVAVPTSFNSFGLTGAGAGQYICQVDLVCVAQY